MMKTLLSVIAVSAVLSACGGGGSDTPDVVIADAPTGTTDDNCQSDYFREIAGVYDGQIIYTSNNLDIRSSCVWDVDFEVVTRVDDSVLGVCETFANITSNLLSGDTTDCSDIAQAGDFFQPVSGTGDEVVTFPVRGVLNLSSPTPSGSVHPTGRFQSTDSIEVIFDGLGNITYPTGQGFTGVLVKQP